MSSGLLAGGLKEKDELGQMLRIKTTRIRNFVLTSHCNCNELTLTLMGFRVSSTIGTPMIVMDRL